MLGAATDIDMSDCDLKLRSWMLAVIKDMFLNYFCKAGMLALITWPMYKFENYIWRYLLNFLLLFHLIPVFITSLFPYIAPLCLFFAFIADLERKKKKNWVEIFSILNTNPFFLSPFL